MDDLISRQAAISEIMENLETDVVAVFKMLAAAYDTLEEWSREREE